MMPADYSSLMDISRDDLPVFYIARVASGIVSEIAQKPDELILQAGASANPQRKESYHYPIDETRLLTANIYITTYGDRLPDGTSTGLVDGKFYTHFIVVNEKDEIVTTATQPKKGDEYVGIERGAYHVSLVGPVQVPYLYDTDGKPTSDRHPCFITIDQFGHIGNIYGHKSIESVLRILFTRYVRLGLDLNDFIRDDVIHTPTLVTSHAFHLFASLVECREHRAYFVPTAGEKRVTYQAELHISLPGDRVVFRVITYPGYLESCPKVTEESAVSDFYRNAPWKKYLYNGRAEFGFKESWSFADKKFKDPEIQNLYYPFSADITKPSSKDHHVLFDQKAKKKLAQFTKKMLENAGHAPRIKGTAGTRADKVLAMVLDPSSTKEQVQNLIQQTLDNFIADDKPLHATAFIEFLYIFSDMYKISPRIIDGPMVVRSLERLYPESELVRTLEFRNLVKGPSILNPGAEND